MYPNIKFAYLAIVKYISRRIFLNYRICRFEPYSVNLTGISVIFINNSIIVKKTVKCTEISVQITAI